MNGERGGSRKRWRSWLMLGAVLACAMMLSPANRSFLCTRLYTSDEVVFESESRWKLGDGEPNENLRDHADGFREGRGRRLRDYVYDEDSPTAQLAEDFVRCSSGEIAWAIIHRRGANCASNRRETFRTSDHGARTYVRENFDRWEHLRMSFLDDDWVARAIARRAALSIDSEAEGYSARGAYGYDGGVAEFVVDHADDDEAFSFDSG